MSTTLKPFEYVKPLSIIVCPSLLPNDVWVPQFPIFLRTGVLSDSEVPNASQNIYTIQLIENII